MNLIKDESSTLLKTPQALYRDDPEWNLADDESSLLTLDPTLPEPRFEGNPSQDWKFDNGQIRLAEDVEASGVLRILHLIRAGGSHTSTVKIEIARGAKGQIIEEWVDLSQAEIETASASPLVTTSTTLHLAEGSYLSLSLFSQIARSFEIDHTASLEKDSHLSVRQILLGGQKGRNTWNSACLGSGSRVDMVLAAKSEGDESQSHSICVEHPAPRSQSDLKVWAVAGDRSKIQFLGDIKIPQSGKGVDAVQKSRGLLLTKEGTIDSIPNLEIACDDVKVAHGASVAPISEEQLYFLRSRGIEAGEAQSMIIDGFYEPVLAGFPAVEATTRARRILSGKRAHETF